MRTDLATPPRVRRILVILRGPIEPMLVVNLSEELGVNDAHVAVCYELPPGRDGLHDGLAAQRQLTSLLRQACGTRAESIPVFTASGRSGEGVVDCQTAWGATEVKS